MNPVLTILILEDHDDDRFLLERALRQARIRFTSKWVHNRRDFIAALELSAPEVILADCHLPDINAVDALEIARRLRPEVPIVFVTGGLSDEQAAGLLRGGAQDYVLKDRLARLGPAVVAAYERSRALALRCEDAKRVKDALLGTIEAIARTVEMRDPYTAGHQTRVAQIAVAIGREAGMSQEQLEGLRLGAQVHDIGKIYVPAEILCRPGRLTRAEYELIKSHPQVGYDIVKDIAFPWPVAQMVLQHHERLDGSGYPRGLKGDEILPEAMVIAVADVLESMVSHRPYRPGLGLAAAMKEIVGKRDVHFPGAVVDACIRVVEQDPAFFGAAPLAKAA